MVFEVLLVTPVVVLASLLIPELHFPLTQARFVAFIVSLAGAFLLSTLMGTTFGMVATTRWAISIAQERASV